MSNAVKDLTSDQLRRIFRDYLKGVPKERLMKKYDMEEEVFWEIVGMYSKKKHPNDVGNAQDLEGPADLLVTPLDTGSTATENPIQARSPKDLRVPVEQVIKEFDYDSPEEELRKKGGEVNDLIAKRKADEAKVQRDEAAGIVKDNKETTDAILRELSEVSKAEAKASSEQASEVAKAAPSPEEVARAAREAREAQIIADNAGEEARAQKVLEHAENVRERDQELIEKGKKQNEQADKEVAEFKKLEAEARKADAEALRKEAERGQEELARVAGGSEDKSSGEAGASDKRPGGSAGAGSDRPAQEAGAGGGAGAASAVVEKANTSPTAQPNPVEPAKVEPGAGKLTDK